MRKCEGCDVPLGPMDLDYTVCWDCTVLRARAVVRRKCVCSKFSRRPSPVKSVGSRHWISCDRCLATIKQLS